MAEPTPPAWRVSVQGWITLLALGLGLWLIISHAGLLMEVAWVLFGALLLALAIRPLTDVLARWHVPRGITVLGVYAGLAGALALMGVLLAPIIEAEVARLQTQGPTLLREALARVAVTPLLGQWLPSIDMLVQNLVQRLDDLLRTFVSTVTGVGGLAIDLLVMLILTYFIATDVGLGERLLNAWIPQHYRPRARVVLAHLLHRLTRWVWAQAAIAFYFALTFSVGLAVLGVPFAFTIGVVGGALEVVPYLGGAVGLLLAILSALTVRPVLALWVVLFYAVVMEIEAHIVAPAFYGRVMGLHPAAVLIALLVGAKAKGILGVLFAIPVAVVLAALMQEVQVALLSPETELPTRCHREER